MVVPNPGIHPKWQRINSFGQSLTPGLEIMSESVGDLAGSRQTTGRAKRKARKLEGKDKRSPGLSAGRIRKKEKILRGAESENRRARFHVSKFKPTEAYQ
jgi:hypothetical protein